MGTLACFRFTKWNTARRRTWRRLRKWEPSEPSPSGQVSEGSLSALFVNKTELAPALTGEPVVVIAAQRRVVSMQRARGGLLLEEIAA